MAMMQGMLGMWVEHSFQAETLLRVGTEKESM